MGRVVAETNQLGLTRTFEYDEQGRLVAVELPAVTDPQNGNILVRPRYEYEFDAMRNQTLIRDPLGRETQFTFDARGNQLSRTLPLGVGTEDDFVERFEYDIFGRQILARTFEGKIIRFVYDEGTEFEKGTGQLKSKEFFDNQTDYDNDDPAETIEFQYDAFGRLVAVTDPRGETTYTYDAQGNLTRVVSPEGTINYEYDALGRKTRTTTDDGDVEDPVNDFTYEYDSLGRLASVTVVERNDVVLEEQEQTAYAYDLQGNLDLQTNPNGVITDYSYDELNRLTDLVHYLPDETPETLADNDKLAEFNYEVRADGRRTQAIETFWFDDATHVNNIAWTYDDSGRLIDEVFDHYDDDFDQTQHFTYDLVGNRLLRTLDEGNDADIDQVFASLYDANDRLLTEEADTNNDSTIDQTTTYGYTGTQQASKTVVEGSTTTSETTYEYNLRGQLQKVTSTANSSTTVSEYEYDHNGVRVKQTVTIDAGTPVVTTYLIDAQNFTGYAKPIAEFVDGVVSRVYTFGHQIISQADASGNVQHFVLDGSGSTRLLLNAALTILETYHFDAFGEAIGFDPAMALTTWLRSQDSQHDRSAGLEYHLARWRDGHFFLTLDPFFGNLHDPQSLHKRLYAHSDPISGSDPSGWENSISMGTASSIGGSMNATNQGGVAFGLNVFTRAFIPSPILFGFYAIGIESGKALAITLGTRILFTQLLNGMGTAFIGSNIDPTITNLDRLASVLIDSPLPAMNELRTSVMSVSLQAGRIKQSILEGNAARYLVGQLGLVASIPSMFDLYYGVEHFLHTVETFISDTLPAIISAQPLPVRLAISAALQVDGNSTIDFKFDRYKVISRVIAGDASDELLPLIVAVKGLNAGGVQQPIEDLRSFIRGLKRWGDLKIDSKPAWL